MPVDASPGNLAIISSFAKVAVPELLALVPRSSKHSGGGTLGCWDPAP